MYRSFKIFFSVLIVMSVLVFIGGESLVAADHSAESNFTKGFSIGINDIPWDATKVVFRWWRNEYSGIEFEIGDFSLSITNSGVGGSDNNYTNINVGRIRFNFLKRRAAGDWSGLYLVYGVGVGVSFAGKWEESDFSYTGCVQKKTIQPKLLLFVPFGVEHFFWKRFPYLSYSLEADLYFSGTYRYKYRHSESEDIVETQEYGDYFLGMGFDSRFFLRLYF